MTVNFTPEQIKQILTAHHANTARIQADNNEANKPLQNFKAIMARRNNPRIVTTQKTHVCSQCNISIQKGTQAWYTPSRICAKSTRCSDASTTGPRYTCMDCASKEKQTP